MLVKETYRKVHTPFNSIAPLLDTEFDDTVNDSWFQNVTQPRYRPGVSGCAFTDVTA